MIVLRLIGGLGNQMFQYALYEKFKYLNKKVLLDDYRREDTCFKEHEIKRVFHMEYDYVRVPGYLICRIICFLEHHVNRILFNRFGIRRFFLYHKEKDCFTYDSAVLEKRHGYFYGLWQSEKYFMDIREIICDRFTFPSITDERNKKYEELICNQVSVSIHVRGGDYLDAGALSFGGICTEEYYTKAINYIKEIEPEAVFFIFTNDRNFANSLGFIDKENSFVFVEGNNSEQSFRDMQLMSMCNHNIIANSTYSWWGAWLNQHKNKIVIAPSKWSNKCTAPDICPPGWVRL